MRVGTKLLLLALLPVGCVFALAAVSAVSDYRNASRLSRYRADAELSFALAPLAVDVAHERRAAVLVRVDPGAAANAQLALYERTTTQAFAQVLRRARHVSTPVDVVGALDAARTRRQALLLQLDARSLPPDQAVAGYSVITRNLLDLAAALDGGAPSPASARAAAAYGPILQAIEAASRERVFVAPLLARGGRSTRLSSSPWPEVEAAELAAFRQNADGPLLGDLEAVLFSPAGTAVQHFRDELADNPAAATRAISLQQWLSVSGTRIDALRAVAAATGRRLVSVVSDELDSARAAAGRDLGISIAVLVLVTALALALRRSITRPLRGVSTAALGLAHGDIAADVAYSSRDEIGNVAAAFRDVHATAERLVDEIQTMNHAVREDRLEHRASVDGLEGVSAQLLAGLNDTMAAFAGARGELRRVADEQAVLRRVATLVARGASPQLVFSSVAEGVADVLPAVDIVLVGRYSEGPSLEFVGGWSSTGGAHWVGQTVKLGGGNVSTKVFDTREPARVDVLTDDASVATATALSIGARSAAGAPINVEGKLWGVITVASLREAGLPIGIEHELAGFTELIATAMANAHAREEVAASRARVVAAGDEARRRIERDLHDGSSSGWSSSGFSCRRPATWRRGASGA